MSEPTHVTIGADQCRDYQFLAPLSALVWRDLIGFNPVVMKVGDWTKTRRGNVALEFMDKMNVPYVHVEPMPAYEDGRTAQQCRELVGCLPLHDNDWAMPTDADLWPIKKEWYYQHYDHPRDVTSYYSNGDHYQTLPTCHVTMRLWKWRQLYGCKAGDDITEAVSRNFHEWLPKRKFWKGDLNFTNWMADQGIVSHKVMNLPEGYNKVERLGHPPVDRIDRGNWQPLTERIIDAHLFRPADQPQFWPRVFELFKALVPQHAEVASTYREQYILGY